MIEKPKESFIKFMLEHMKHDNFRFEIYPVDVGYGRGEETVHKLKAHCEHDEIKMEIDN